MSVSKQIILSSTIVALMAAFGGYIGWKNIQHLKKKFLEKGMTSKEDVNILIENLDNLNYWIVLICGLTFLLAIVFGQVIAYFLSKSLGELKEVANNIGNGNYDTKTTITGQNELGKIGQTFNLFADNLQHAKIIEEKNEELADLNIRLKVKNDSLDNFVYRVSHDLKAPVVNLASLQKLIIGQINNIDNTILQSSIRHMGNSIEKLQKTIHDLLEVSRIERSLKAEKKWIDLTKVLEETRKENVDTINATQAEFKINFKAAPKIFFSQSNMESLFSNLINNGLKYRSEERAPVIQIQTEEREDFICLSISDNGIGIDLDRHKDKLFGMFNRFHNHVDGSGVGLYIVKKLVEDNGGKIEVESKVGEGTTFKLFFKQPKDTSISASMN